MKWQIIIQDIVEIFLHENHGVGESVLLVVSAVVHVGVITEDDTSQQVQQIKNVSTLNLVEWSSCE